MSPSCCSCQSPAGTWLFPGGGRSHSSLCSPLPPETTICIAEIPAAPRLLLLPLVFPTKSRLGREPEQAGHCNLVMEGTGACSLFTHAAQPADEHKKRQQTLPGKLSSRAEEWFYCCVKGVGPFSLKPYSAHFWWILLSAVHYGNQYLSFYDHDTMRYHCFLATWLDFLNSQKDSFARIYFKCKIHSELYSNSVICP